LNAEMVSARRVLWWTLGLGCLASTTAVAAAAGRDTSRPDAAPTTSPTVPPRRNPLTPTDPNRIPVEQAAAIDALALVASPLRPSGAHGHAPSEPQGPAPSVATADQQALDRELAVAVAAATGLRTPEQATAAGYRRAAVNGAGVGTHWVKWSLIDEPFDPAAPAMLLFDGRPGRTEQLVGFSYWIRSPQEPAGFAGATDHWHQHAGYCIINGWIDRENAASAADCGGTFLGGSDLWMLHAWIVPGWSSIDGVFSTINQKLCPPAAGTPDLARCELFVSAN
jgi:hypothetical protein